MQRSFPRCFLWFRAVLAAWLALYVSGFASATTELPAADKPVAHIALLLPLNSPALGAAAETIRQGILAASSLQKPALPLRIYSDFDEANSVLASYQRAVSSGAIAVIGPLTRGGIRQLADQKTLPVSTLALNIIEGPMPQQLYLFGMAMDAEARQLARLARKQGSEQAIVISANEPLARRLQFAFEEQWTASGGTILREIEFNGDTAVLADIAAAPERMIFFATDAEKTRTIRPFLPNALAAYATSQLFADNRNTLLNFDLDGIHFVDMPWLLQSELPAVAAYPRANLPLPNDQERLYALGIDAFRLINSLIDKQEKSVLDGVTGLIRLNGQIFQREALPALFVRGHGQSADAPVAPAVQLFPDQFKNASQAEPASAIGLIPKP